MRSALLLPLCSRQLQLRLLTRRSPHHVVIGKRPLKHYTFTPITGNKKILRARLFSRRGLAAFRAIRAESPRGRGGQTLLSNDSDYQPPSLLISPNRSFKSRYNLS